MATQLACRFALLAFGTASLQAVLANEGFAHGLGTALVAGVGFYVIGAMVGYLVARLVDEGVEREMDRWKQEVTRISQAGSESAIADD